MKFILALTDSRRKSIAFVTDPFKVVSLNDAIKATALGNVDGVHVVKRGKTEYVRTNPSFVRTNIGIISVPWCWFFAAAKMRADIDEWAPFKDISKLPEIVATVYSYHATPHDNPKPSNRGLQIANEFYPLAKEMLDNV